MLNQVFNTGAIAMEQPLENSRTTPHTAGIAIASLVLGILSITCFSILTGIPALILGIVALLKISKSAGALRGQGMAIAGVVTGSISVILVPLIAALAIPALSQARAQAHAVVCLNNVKMCSIACRQFAQDNGGRLPSRWEDLERYLGGSAGMKNTLVCPADRNANGRAYELLHGGEMLGSFQDPGKTIIVRESEASHRGKRTVGFADGLAEMHADK